MPLSCTRGLRWMADRSTDAEMMFCLAWPTSRVGVGVHAHHLGMNASLHTVCDRALSQYGCGPSFALHISTHEQTRMLPHTCLGSGICHDNTDLDKHLTTHTHSHTHTHTQMRTDTHGHAQLHMHTHRYLLMRTDHMDTLRLHGCALIHTDTHTYTQMHTDTHRHTHIHTYIYVQYLLFTTTSFL